MDEFETCTEAGMLVLLILYRNNYPWPLSATKRSVHFRLVSLIIKKGDVMNKLVAISCLRRPAWLSDFETSSSCFTE
ncbi:hypothetical protein WN944_028784 [Citrus x changshan-huyou]|uniref:Uncharacterized protein n=1 Tax=Citrus x changshan-huyou TaxID=2935761 RepID=A0AAP0Q9R7_9ROSI